MRKILARTQSGVSRSPQNLNRCQGREESLLEDGYWERYQEVHRRSVKIVSSEVVGEIHKLFEGDLSYQH